MLNRISVGELRVCDCRAMGRSEVALTLSSFRIDRKLVYGETNIFDGVEVSYVRLTTSLNWCVRAVNDGGSGTLRADVSSMNRYENFDIIFDAVVGVVASIRSFNGC